MHSIVTRLEKEDLLRRMPHPNHRRIKQPHRTDEGQPRLDQACEIVEAIKGWMTEEVSRDEVEQAKRVLIGGAQASKGE